MRQLPSAFHRLSLPCRMLPQGPNAPEGVAANKAAGTAFKFVRGIESPPLKFKYKSVVTNVTALDTSWVMHDIIDGAKVRIIL